MTTTKKPPPKPVVEEPAAVGARLRADAEEVRAAMTQLRADEGVALARCSEHLRTSFEAMQGDLDEARDRLAVERARSTQELRDELHELVDDLHAAFDDLRVQLHLAGLEASDGMDGVRTRLQAVIDLGTGAVGRARDALGSRTG